MSSGSLSPLLLDWTEAITTIQLDKVQQLLNKEPELLWTPIPQTLIDVDHLLNRLHQSARLGNSFQPVCAIHYALIYYQEVSTETIQAGQLNRYQLLSYLIQQSTLHDLDTRFWGEHNNSTLHLVSFLGHQQIALSLVDRGVTINPVNELGYLPRDVANSEAMFQYLSSTNHKQKQSLPRTKTVRPNYSNPNRFKLLKELAEESSIQGDENKKASGISEVKNGQYFRKGRVRETQQKVLTEEEVELEKQRLRRQKEVAQLAKRSAVKNNPLFKKLETRSFTLPSPSPFASGTTVSIDTTTKPSPKEEKRPESPIIKRNPKRNSKVISSLKVKSYVTSSIFVQADEETADRMSPPSITPIMIPDTTRPENNKSVLEVQPSPKSAQTVTIKSPRQQELPVTNQETTLEPLETMHLPTVVSPREIQESPLLSPIASPKEIHESPLSSPIMSPREMEDSPLLSPMASPKEIQDSPRFSSLVYETKMELPHDEITIANREPMSTSSQAVQENVLAHRIEQESLMPSNEPTTTPLVVTLESKFEVSIEEQESLLTIADDKMSSSVNSSPVNAPFQYPAEDIHQHQNDSSSSDDDNVEYYDSLSMNNDELDEESEDIIDTLSHSHDDVVLHDSHNSSGSDRSSSPDGSTVVNDNLGLSPALSAAKTSSMISNDFDDLEDDSDYEEMQFSARLVNPVYRSVVLLDEDSARAKMEYQKYENVQTSLFNLDDPSVRPESTIDVEADYSSNKIEVTDLNERSSSMEPSFVLIPPMEDQNSTPTRPQKSSLRQEGGRHDSRTKKQKENEMKRRSGSQKASWTMSMSSWAAILDKEFNLDELDPQKKYQQQIKNSQPLSPQPPHSLSLPSASLPPSQPLPSPPSQSLPSPALSRTVTSEDLLSKIQQEIQDEYSLNEDDQEDDDKPDELTLASTLTLSYPISKTNPTNRSFSADLSSPPRIEVPSLQPQKSVHRKPLNTSLFKINEPNKRSASVSPISSPVKNTRTFKHGKLYLHVNGIQDILLPLPKDRAYVRCVVSDGRFEYMSRYEILSQDIDFNYECVIDTHPDMIITISLHVRPDYIMKSRKPFARLFTSKKKKKECLSGYVNKEDGAIGQARFALAHMLPVCEETAYVAGFHCFNAWYTKTFKERHRQKKTDPSQDVLKVVGNFNVEMLYLHVEDSRKIFPRTLRECEKLLTYR
ncbi:hypothetical protein BDB01DRAFT_848285 [Pilobolus umbonatus]|nr:hypothetical protein BDB01DRAFT_848285 [Pilobolus umbonatus]